ncbi:hypothetical protein Tco_1459449 [Tanacetum coccineum]
MRIFGFVHGITNPELIKRFHEKIPKTVDEMMQVATSFLQGQEAASNQERKKVPQAWRHSFTLLTKTPKEILALEKGKFKTPPPMTTPVEKQNANKFCEFHGEVGAQITDEMQHAEETNSRTYSQSAVKLSHILYWSRSEIAEKNSEQK